MSRPRVVAVCVFFISFSALGASFTPGNVVIYRVGNGASALTTSAAPVFLEEHDRTSGALVQTIPMWTTGPLTLTAAGTTPSEGLLTRSVDGAYLMVTGYGEAPGTPAPYSPFMIEHVAPDGTIDEWSSVVNSSSSVNIRSAVSLDGYEFWATTGGNGLQYAILGAGSTTTISDAGRALRAAEIFDGQLYVSSIDGTRLGAVGSGVPTTSTTTTALPGFPTSAQPSQFFFADLDGKPGVDTLYVADTAAGITKYSLVSGSWVPNGTIGGFYRGMTGVVSAAGVTLYVTGDGTNVLSTLTDTTGYNATIAGTLVTLATAPANTAYRGVAFVPGPAPGAPASLTATATGINTVNLSWPAVAGAAGYDVYRIGAGSPATRIGLTASASYIDSTASADASYLYFVRAFDASGLRSANSPSDLATTVMFHDDPLVSGSTIVQAAHIIELRTAIDAVRSLAGLASATYSDTPIVGGPVKAVDITELRTALDAARSALVLPAITYGETIVAGTTAVKASHVTELRDGVK